MRTEQQIGSPSREQSSEMMKTTLAVAGLRAERIQIHSSEKLDKLTKLSNNLHNEVNQRI